MIRALRPVTPSVGYKLPRCMNPRGCPAVHIRVNNIDALQSYSRLTEIEAWTAAAQGDSAPATTTLGSVPNPAVAGTTAIFTASVAGNAATDTVGVNDGTPITNCSTVALTPGNPSLATFSTGSLTVGRHIIAASYGGNAGNAASWSAPARPRLAAPETRAAPVGGGRLGLRVFPPLLQP